MAFNDGNINFKFPLRKVGKGYFEGNKTTLAAVREDIKILLLTSKGERVMHKTLGTNIPIFDGELFDQISPEEMKIRLSNEIRTALKEWMPHIRLVSLEVIDFTKDDRLRPNEIVVKMDYVLTNAEQLKDTIQLRLGA